MPITVEQVRHCYNAILRREPSPGEVRRWSGDANGERSPAGMTETLIAQATEVRSIARLYAGLLGRFPESLAGPIQGADALEYWTGVLRAFRSDHAGIPYREALAYLVHEWFREPELLSRFKVEDIDRYTAELCVAVLDRNPAPEEAAAWAGIAADPERGRARLAVTLSESKECKGRLDDTINKKLRAQAHELLLPLTSPPV